MAEDQPNPNRSPDDETPAAEPSNDGTPVASDPDATHPVDPVVDPDATRPVGPGATSADGTQADPDATRPIDSGSEPPVDPGATQILKREAARPADPDATQVTPIVDADATRAIPAVDDAATHPLRPQTPEPTAIMPTPPEVWRGTAAPRASTPEPDQTSMWDPQEGSRGRGWFLPVLLSIIGILILVGLAFALVVAMRGNPSPAPTTPPTAPVATTPASVAPVTPSVAPSASPPPSASSSPTPTPDGSFVTVPANMVGLLTLDVEARLSVAGLGYHLIPQVDGDVLENTVLSISPVSGSAVPPGSTVDIVYAVPPPPSPSDSASPAQ